MPQEQPGLNNSQNQLQELYQKAQELILQYRQEAQRRQMQEEVRRNQLEQELTQVMADNVRNMQSLEQQLDKIFFVQRIVAEKIAQRLGDDKVVEELKKIRQEMPTTFSYN